MQLIAIRILGVCSMVLFGRNLETRVLPTLTELGEDHAASCLDLKRSAHPGIKKPPVTGAAEVLIPTTWHGLRPTDIIQQTSPPVNNFSCKSPLFSRLLASRKAAFRPTVA